MFLLRRTLPFLALLAVAPQIALAHAVLVVSKPTAQAIVHGESLPVILKFNSRIDGPHCTLALAREGRAPQPLKLQKQPAPDTIEATADHLQPGSYTLQWQALAADGHITRGQIPFTVTAAAADSHR